MCVDVQCGVCGRRGGLDGVRVGMGWEGGEREGSV